MTNFGWPWSSTVWYANQRCLTIRSACTDFLSLDPQSAYTVSNGGMKLRKDRSEFRLSLCNNGLRPQPTNGIVYAQHWHLGFHKCLLQSTSIRQQLVPWDIHRRKFQLLVLSHLGKQFQIEIYCLLVDPKI